MSLLTFLRLISPRFHVAIKPIFGPPAEQIYLLILLTTDRNIAPNVLNNTWFKKFNLSRSSIVQFVYLPVNHSLLPANTFKFSVLYFTFKRMYFLSTSYPIYLPSFVQQTLNSVKLLLLFQYSIRSFVHP